MFTVCSHQFCELRRPIYEGALCFYRCTMHAKDYLFVYDNIIDYLLYLAFWLKAGDIYKFFFLKRHAIAIKRTWNSLPVLDVCGDGSQSHAIIYCWEVAVYVKMPTPLSPHSSMSEFHRGITARNPPPIRLWQCFKSKS